jgi:hypothetical protein
MSDVTRRRIIGCAIVWSVLATLLGAADQFVFGGLGLSVTVDAQRLYPHSTIAGQRVTVADVDVRDHIRVIQLGSRNIPPGRLLRTHDHSWRHLPSL